MSRKLYGVYGWAVGHVCFNGAETKMSRKSCYVGHCTPYMIASMGPRQKCLGNVLFLTKSKNPALLQWGRDKNVSEIVIFIGICAFFAMLQWGRDKNVSEILRPDCYFVLDVLLQWGRDKNVSEMPALLQHYTATYGASMGPRQKCLGNLKAVTIAYGTRPLQWGRDKNVSEIQERQ